VSKYNELVLSYVVGDSPAIVLPLELNNQLKRYADYPNRTIASTALQIVQDRLAYEYLPGFLATDTFIDLYSSIFPLSLYFPID
jgi:hypothetical protein